MYRSLLTDASFYELLCRIDADLAATARAADCPNCSGRLDCADYPRKPRGGPETLGAEYASRHSFCCARDGCRRRTTPPSVRFLGRRVYLGGIVVLATALQHGPTPTRMAQLRQLLGMTAKTLGRWRAWWQEAFVASHCWRAARSRFDRPVNETSLPASLLERFGGDSGQRLVGALRLLAPLTTTSARRVVVEGRR